jgi:hypothetical protein
MDNFKKDIDGIFEKCVEDLLWYSEEYDLNPQEMKKVFIEYANEWFDTYAKEKEEED